METLLRLCCLLLGLAACAPAAQPDPAPTGVNPDARAPQPEQTLRVPGTDLSITVRDAFWRGERVAFAGPGADKGTLEQVARPLTIRQGKARLTLLALEVQRVSGKGGLYLVALPENSAVPASQGSAFLGKNVRLLRLTYGEGVITATVADARLGRPPLTAPQPGHAYRFRLEDGQLLEVD